MGFITDTVYLTGRLYRQTLRLGLPHDLRRPIRAKNLLFGQLFGGSSGPGSDDELPQFLAPGIAVMAALFGSIPPGSGC